LLDFVPSILEEAETSISSFYKSQAKINSLYRRAKRITSTTHIERYPTDYIEKEFSKTREELDDIYYKITS